MDDRDVLSVELPPPREDEPLGLRQDILDELADHLGCAYRRELLRGAGPVEARQRVLNRFGDPAAVARRLWLDAMKGKIMAQRILVATCLVVTLASLAVVGILSQQSIRAQRDAARMAVEAQNNQREMLKQLREMSDAIRNPRSFDWNPLTFKLTEETPAGPALAGVVIMLAQADQRPQNWISRTTDGSGVADFGLVNPGTYNYQFSETWASGLLGGSGKLRVEPGRQVNKVIVFPKHLLESVPLRMRSTWPNDLEKERLILEAQFQTKPIVQDEVEWTIQHRWTLEQPDTTPFGMSAPLYIQTRSVLSGPGPALAEVFNSRPGLYLWGSDVENPPKTWADVLTNDIREVKDPGGTLMWEQCHYQLTKLTVLRPVPSSDGKESIRHFEVLAEGYSWGGGQRGIRHDPPTEKELKTALATMGEFRPQPSSVKVKLPAEFWTRMSTRFDARPGQVNEWTIPLPDELIKVVREKLKVAKP